MDDMNKNSANVESKMHIKLNDRLSQNGKTGNSLIGFVWKRGLTEPVYHSFPIQHCLIHQQE